MRKKIFIALAVVGAFSFCMGLVKFFRIRAAIAEHANFQPPPESVTSFVAKLDKWSPAIDTVGNIAPYQGATMSTEEAGRVRAINFTPGARVKEGDVLIELDTSVEEANLESARAKAAWATKSFERAKKLREENAVSIQAFDDAQSQLRQANADAGSLEAIINRKRISAPFAGRVGVRAISIGQYVTPGMELVSLQNTDRLLLNFNVPQKQSALVSEGLPVSFEVDAYPGEIFTATISAINPNVDVASRNVSVQGSFSNEAERLKPGMFAKVKVLLPITKDVIIIPLSSVKFASYGDSVYVIDDAKRPDGTAIRTVRQQIIALGLRRGDFVAIEKGLKVGEEVVTTGLFKLRPNAEVVVNNSLAPNPETAPNPANT